MVGLLTIFKYASFVFLQLTYIHINVPQINITLPIGISFYVFQMLSYIFDVYYEKVPFEKNYLNVALYVVLFPQLVAGPIVRYNTIADEILNRKETLEDFELGIKRFVIGLGKKALIADVLGANADAIFNSCAVANVGAITAWIGAISYTLEIYYDFSAYSDMAIGLGRCFGFHFPENFNYPYISTSITDFWKRWHMSLTDWFRDYVYIPMGGNRVSRYRHICNITIVWILTGIWHGANWTFLIWGMVYCLFQILERFVYDVKILPKCLRLFYTMFIVNMCWVLFRVDNISMFFKYVLSMFGRYGFLDINSLTYLRMSWIIFIISCIGCTPFLKRLYRILIGKSAYLRDITIVFEYIILIGILIMTVCTSISQGYSPFIYFNF